MSWARAVEAAIRIDTSLLATAIIIQTLVLIYNHNNTPNKLT